MTKDTRSLEQPALWGHPEIARPAGTAKSSSRTRAAAAPSIPDAEIGQLWTIDEVAAYLGVPKQTIYCWRTTGYGPLGFRVGKHLRWHASTVQKWTADLESKQ